MTVLHVAQPTGGGVAQVVTDLVRTQTAAGVRTALLCPPGGPLGGAARAAGAEVRDWVAGREPGGNLPWEAAFVARAVRGLRPDVVHLHSAKAGLAGRLGVRGRVPTVFQPHAWSFEAAEGVTRRAAVRWERLAARWADRVVCVSEAERDLGVRAGVTARWSVIRNGIDLARYPAAGEVDRRQARAALAAVHGLPQRAPLVVCVGRLCRQKGQDLLLAAWRRVLERVPGARLVLVGDGPERARLEATADPRHVLFAGHTDDPVPWYTAADLVVQPSRWEGMALAPLEAMAVGRAVLLSDVGGGRESLAPGQADECLVPAGDVAALGQAMTALLTAPERRRALARAAQAHTRATRGTDTMAAAYAELYADVRGPCGPAHQHRYGHGLGSVRAAAGGSARRGPAAPATTAAGGGPGDERVDDVGPQVPVADGTAIGERERNGASRAGDPAAGAREASTRDGRAPVAGSAAGGADARPAGRAGAPRGPGGPERLPGKGPGAVFVVAGWSPGKDGPDGVPVPDGAAGPPVGAHGVLPAAASEAVPAPGGALTTGGGEGPDARDGEAVRGTEPTALAVPPPATDAESGALADSPSTSASTSASPSAAGANGGGHAHG
ncbi:glycosyltransferase [Streptomyces sp. JH002]|uniref:glycosyltransferase n=1 Tax=Streptomyces sp. JH002 TaxID=2763259 RepID=UPI003D802E6E